MPSQRYNNKANGPVGIPAEILKARGAKLHQHIHALIMTIWDQEVIPSDLRDALIVILFKKGDKADCGNYRGISLLSINGTIISLPETQCGLRSACGTTDMI